MESRSNLLKSALFLLSAACLPVSSWADTAENKQQNTPEKEITPSARGCSDTICGPFLTGDFIFWQVNEDGLLYAEKNVPRTGQTTITFKEVGSDWNPGFKVGAGYNLPKDGWDLYLNWTWLHENKTSRVSGEEEQVSSVFDNDETATHAKARFKFRYNTLDLELGRNLFLSPKLTIRPVIGLRGGWIDQNLTVRYSGDISNPVMITKNVQKNDFFAGGPRVGLETRFGTHWGVFGNIYTSFLFGKQHIKSTGYSVDFLGMPISLIRRRDEFRVRPNVQLALGADWGTCFGKDRYINLSAAYEMQYWWHQWQALSLPNFLEQGDLVLQGLTAQLRFDF